MPGTLALVGAGEFLDTMSAVDRQLLDRAGGSKVVILPTASAPDGAGVPERWIKMGVEHFTRIGAQADGLLALDRAACDDAVHADRVRAANLVYFSGGKPDYLRSVLDGTVIWSAVRDVFERGGVIAGCSAGAMIMGGYVPEFSMRASVPWIDRWRESFALLPGAIIVPHYNEFPEVIMSLLFRRRPPGTYVIGIDGHTALVGVDSTWQVLGAGRVTVRRGRDTKRYTAGQAVPLNS
jgi:cyanophycinase